MNLLDRMVRRFFAIAITATALEITGLKTCPRTAGGAPACYYAAGIAILFALLFIHVLITASGTSCTQQTGTSR